MHQRTARRSRRLTGAVTAALLASSLAAAPALAVEDTDPGDDDTAAITRFAGANRYDTSKDFAARGIGAAQSAVVTTGENFPDALAGAYLAGNAVGPVVLTPPSGLADESREAVAALTDNDDWSGTVYVLGGTGAVSEAVVDGLEAIDGVDEVVRISGADRFETAARVALTVPGTDTPDVCNAAYLNCLPVVDDLNCDDVNQVVVLRDDADDPYGLSNDGDATGCDGEANPAAAQVGEIDDEDDDSSKTAILATGQNFPDALVAGVMSRAGQIPILLTQPDAVPEVTANTLDGLEIEQVVLAGGEAVINDAVAMALESDGYTVERVSGADRHRTAVAFADFINERLPDFDTTGRVGLATGYGFPDALSMAPFAGGPGRFPILLTRPDAIDPFTEAEIAERSTQGFQVFVAGGTAAVPEAVAEAGAEAGEEDGPDPDGAITNTADSADPDSGSLRAAVIAANADAGDQTITLQSGQTYTLDIAGTDEDAAATGDLDVTGGLTIEGNGATIEMDDDVDRVLDVRNGASLTLDDVTVTGGATQDSDGREGFGGGIRVEDGALVVTGGAIEDNTASKAGGGVEVNGGQSATFTNVDFTDNVVNGAAPAAVANGGAIHSTGDVDVTGGVVRDNIAAEEGGGFWQGAGTMTVDSTEFYGNRANGTGADQGGGALFVIGGTLDVTDALMGATGDGGVNQNVATSSGGAILVDDGDLAIRTSTLRGNRAVRAGGAIELAAEVGAATPSASLDIDNVRFSDNAATGDGATGPGNGGAIHITGNGDADITESLFERNVAANEGGAFWNGQGTTLVERTTMNANSALIGGGIFNQVGVTRVINSTLSDNTLTEAGGQGTQATNGAGGNVLIFQYSTIVENDTSTASTSLVNLNPAAPAAFSFSLGNTALEGDCGGAGSFSDAGGGNVIDVANCLDGGNAQVDPGVADALADNGGPTAGAPGSTFRVRTHVPLSGASAVVDGSTGVTTNPPLTGGFTYTVDVDQRNVDRPIDGDGGPPPIADSGAVEFDPDND